MKLIMSKVKNKYIDYWLYSLCFMLLMMCFQFNMLRTVDLSKFDFFQYDSQALVVGRLIYSYEKGVSAGNGFLGFVHPVPKQKKKIGYQYLIYEKESRINEFEPYYSQSGGQGICYFLVTKLLGLRGAKSLLVLQGLTSAFTAGMLLLFILWVQRISNRYVAIALFVCIIYSCWIVLFARNLYWVLGIFYLAFIMELWILERDRQGKKWNWRFAYGLIFIAIWLKGWLTGFDYISTYLVMLVIPFLFYAIWQKWHLKKCIIRFGGLGLTALVAFIFVMTVLLYQLSREMGSWEKAIDYIIYTLGKRSYGGENPLAYNPLIQKGVGCSLPELLKVYWESDVIDVSHWFESDIWKRFARVSCQQLSWLFIGFSGWVIYKKWRRKISYRLEWALMISLWFSLLAPLSWFICFKGHSFIHVHMNNIVWYMPYVLLGYVFTGVVLKNIFSHEKSC